MYSRVSYRFIHCIKFWNLVWLDKILYFYLFFVFLYVFGLYNGSCTVARIVTKIISEALLLSEVGQLHWKFRLKMAENTNKKKKGDETPTSTNSRTCPVRYPRPFVKRDTALEFQKQRASSQVPEAPEPPPRISMRPSELATADPAVIVRYHEPIKTTRQPSRAMALQKEWRNRSYSVNLTPPESTPSQLSLYVFNNL